MKLFKTLAIITLAGAALSGYAQNPLITNQYSADPSARVFGDKVYIYPSHDILATKGHGRPGWFCMEDYHVFSSANLTDWTDHGVILTQQKVPWADSTSYSMWAPDCINRNGKYYLYFPTTAKSSGLNGRGFTIGVAIADHPFGPFTPQPDPIKGVHGIDPNVFIDKDGKAYLYYAQGNIFGARLKENMLELSTEPITLGNFPNKGLKEGPYLFERNGIYYMTYPHVENKIERLEYATSNSPLGPFKFAGVIMDESASGCWTNHQSIVQFKNQWYLFYHNDDLSPNFDKARSIRADSLFFNADGTIRKVTPTLRGIGLTRSDRQIQIDRYSDISKSGATVGFIDTAQRMKGWKTTFDQAKAWIRYNSVNFSKKTNVLVALAKSNRANSFEIRLDNADGPLAGTMNISAGKDWNETKVKLVRSLSGRHDLFIIAKTNDILDIDWIKFE